MKLAGIDIGSNAARLLIVDVQKKGRSEISFNKVNLVRVPLRLGFDVFKDGRISKEKKQMLLNTMMAFKNLMNAYSVEAVKACATSAMRDASNSKRIINEVKKKSDIDIEIISGDKEATLVFETHIAEKLDKKKSYLYIDVGGGSTEVDFFVEGQQVYQKSFNLGTIRLLQRQVKEADWESVKNEIRKNIKSKLPVTAIGSGGNINKVFSLSKTKDGLPLSLKQLRAYHKSLSVLSIPQRMAKYELKPDRADVIVPALQIYINIMHWAHTSEIIVPKIGVADGLVHELYSEITHKK
ncbi:exopolyphosphatase [Arachidicoccus ginsenosidimutans]|uniref:Ppx/GppA phosphatase family protein n=1 Tax=Arachidicoccus sp. BS20 TaxID=1850526 RepID=UPI0007F10059|nr:exopolyphosphatase [Arachidicoccus sp. BS20]ANI88453.1 exopolyphosphatase [Arachidicoccus sp. BS20]